MFVVGVGILASTGREAGDSETGVMGHDLHRLGDLSGELVGRSENEGSRTKSDGALRKRGFDVEDLSLVDPLVLCSLELMAHGKKVGERLSRSRLGSEESLRAWTHTSRDDGGINHGHPQRLASLWVERRSGEEVAEGETLDGSRLELLAVGTWEVF
jgi:hypothetical protein